MPAKTAGSRPTQSWPMRLSPRCRHRAFTLVELLVALVIAGVLASIALPSFLQQVRKARRSDAADAAAAVLQRQESWRGNNTAYASTLVAMGLGGASREKYYNLELSEVTGAGYKLNLLAVSGRSQAGDTGCTELTMTVTGGAPAYAPMACWSR